MIEFRLFGIHVSIQPFFWITMAFIGGAFQIGNGRTVFEVVLFIMAGFISILVHEYGHALLIRKYRQPTEIVLQAFGGYATHPAGVFSRLQSFLVSLAGPVIQIALGFIAWAVFKYANLPDTLIKDFFFNLTLVSFFWAVLNLIPVFPMDGGQMLAAALGPRKQHITFLIGVIIPVLVIIAYFKFSEGGGYLLPIFMGLFAYQNWERYNATRPR